MPTQIPIQSAREIARLRELPPLTEIREESLQWILDHAELLSFEPGEFIFRAGEAVDFMQIIFTGEYAISFERNGETRRLGVMASGTITGVLPFSRMKTAMGNGEALQPMEVLRLHKRHFVEMVNVDYRLVQNLVAVMLDRSRDFSEARFQDEKLMALGRLSAGLHHELNNPAAAITRSAEELYRQIHQTPEQFKAVMGLQVTPDEIDTVTAVLFAQIDAHAANPPEMSMLERESARDDLLDWLEDREISEADELAEVFVDFAMDESHLDRLAEVLGDRDMGTVLHWFSNRLALERQVAEIREASSRIAGLIRSVKTYTHMDQGHGQDRVDINEGLRSTLLMLGTRLKRQRISLHTELAEDLPLWEVWPGELNQVWTNLITNALDAMGEDGHLILRSRSSGGGIEVEIEDSGPGIPEDIQTRIWEPFFTTKRLGEGTGMGLDIVKKILDRHRATPTLESEPGRTVFTVCFHP